MRGITRALPPALLAASLAVVPPAGAQEALSPDDGGMTVWHVADSDSDWFSPSTSDFMINYRVDDLEEMIADLKQAGIDIQKGPDYHENGIFAWIMDPDGNKVELWQAMPWDEKNKRD